MNKSKVSLPSIASLCLLRTILWNIAQCQITHHLRHLWIYFIWTHATLNKYKLLNKEHVTISANKQICYRNLLTNRNIIQAWFLFTVKHGPPSCNTTILNRISSIYPLINKSNKDKIDVFCTLTWMEVCFFYLDHVLPSFKVGLLPSFWEVDSIVTISYLTQCPWKWAH